MKKIKHLTHVGLVLLAAVQALPTFASEAKNIESSVETKQAKPESETETFPSFSPRIGASYNTTGAGYDEFGSLEAFIPLLQSPGKNLTFLEGKLLWTTSNGALGGNLLLGHRFKSDTGNYLVGGYVSFDSRNTGDTVFNQLGAGFESLSDGLDFRANAYLPIGNKNVLLASANSGIAFRGNALEIDRVQLFQQALTGFDAEVGTKLLPLGSGSLRGYAGLYYYSAENINGFVGVRGRLVARPNDNLVAGLTLQSDSVFDTRLIFNIGVNLSPGNSRRRSKNSVLARMGESPERQSSIAVDNVSVRDTVAAIDPTTGLAYNFQQVNLGNGNSNGTIESPFGTIQAALNVAKSGDIVYVRSGTNPGVPGFTIPDGVEVVSAATPRFVQTQVGKIQLPGSGSGVLPTVTGTVTLGNNTTLSGFAIANSTGAGVQGSNISNISIEDNTITNSRFQGINLNNVTGTVEILNNTIDKTGTSYSGIDTNSNRGTVELVIAGNQVKNTTSSGDLSALTDGDGINVILEGTVKGNANILNNTTTNNGRIGIVLQGYDNAIATATISNNTSNGNSATGILTYFDNSSQGNVTISNNNVSGNKIGGLESYFVGNSQGSVAISGNNFSVNDGGGIYLGLYDNAKASATISNNQVFGNKEPSTDIPFPGGIGIEADNTAQGNVSVTNNTVADNFYGIISSTDESASLKLSIASNNVTGSLQDGVVITTSSPFVDTNPGTSQTNVSLQNNTVTGNNTTGAGFGDVSVANFRNGSNMCVQAKNNTFGTLTLADKPVPVPLPATQQSLFAKQQQGTITPAELQTLISSLFDGTVRIEGAFPGANTGTLNPSSQSGTIWSKTTATAGSCGFGN